MQQLIEELNCIQTENRIQELPQEVKDRILYFSGSHCRIYLGLELDPWEVFFDSGILVILKTILDNGADLKSLLLMKHNNFATADISVKTLILFIAINTKCVAVVKRICCLWPELQSLDEGWYESERKEFLWGMKNLGSEQVRSRPSWVYVTQLKDYSHIQELMQMKKKSPLETLFYQNAVPKATVADWIRDFPEEHYELCRHERDFVETIQFYKGEQQRYLDWLSDHLLYPGWSPAYEWDFCPDAYLLPVVGGTMYELICEFADKDAQFLDKCIEEYNTGIKYGDFFEGETNLEALVSKVIVNDKLELLPILTKFDGDIQSTINQALEIKSAVDSKDVTALRQLFPDTNPNVYAAPEPVTETKALRYFALFFLIMVDCEFVDEEEYFKETDVNMRAFRVPVTLNPEILIDRILQDISMCDELYTRSMYGLKHLNYDINSLVRYDCAWSRQGHIPIRALYDHYRTDPNFDFSDLDHSLEWPCSWRSDNSQLIWVLYRILKEKISLIDDKNEVDVFSWKTLLHQKKLTFTDLLFTDLTVSKMQSLGKVVAQLKKKLSLVNWEREIYNYSTLHAWAHLIGEEVPDMIF